MGSFKLPNVDAGNSAAMMWKSRKCSQPPIHLSRPPNSVLAAHDVKETLMFMTYIFFLSLFFPRVWSEDVTCSYALSLGGRCASVWHISSSAPFGFEMLLN